MSIHLKIALIQTNLIWENPTANRDHFAEKINTIKPETDLIVLPEMFTTGFTMNTHPLAETMSGKTIDWMKKIAHQKNAALTGSIIIEENNQFYNRMLWVYPNQEVVYYDKKHLFTLANEHHYFSKGNSKTLINFKGFTINLMICYDLRFPVWSRNTENYDALLYVASWPEKRIEAWDTLLKARAIENMAYVVGVNRIGTDNQNINYTGHSIVYDSLGNAITKINNQNDEVIYATLEKNHIEKTRSKFKFIQDRDPFTLH